MTTVILINRDDNERDLLAQQIKALGVIVIEAGGFRQAVQAIALPIECAAVICDLEFQATERVEIVRVARQIHPEARLLAIASSGTDLSKIVADPYDHIIAKASLLEELRASGATSRSAEGLVVKLK